jgi:hypothetical protein
MVTRSTMLGTTNKTTLLTNTRGHKGNLSSNEVPLLLLLRLTQARVQRKINHTLKKINACGVTRQDTIRKIAQIF